MKVYPVIAAILLSAGLLHAEEDWLKVEEAPKSSAVGHEFGFGYGFAADGDMDQGERDAGELNSQNNKAFYIASIPLSDKISLRTGVDYERYSFGLPRGTRMPNTLQSVALKVGADIELTENWLMRFEASPGIYSDFNDISGSDFNVPMILGFTYLVDSKLQVVFGVAIDPLFSTHITGFMDSPVLPGVGVRWQFADKWTLLAILPEPELQYDVNDQVQVFAGVRLKGGVFRVSDEHSGRRQDFNNDVVSYQEVRTGLGARYKFHPALSLEGELGYTVSRSFKFRNEDGLNYDGGGAPYAEIGLKGKF